MLHILEHLGTFKSNGQHECEGIIKVFVTNVASSFPALELPDLAPFRVHLDQHHRDVYHHVARFLDGLAARFRSSPDAAVDENEQLGMSLSIITSNVPNKSSLITLPFFANFAFSSQSVYFIALGAEATIYGPFRAEIPEGQ